MLDSLIASVLALFAPEPEVVQGYVEGDYRYLGPRVAGELTRLSVTEGEEIARGAPLFTLDDRAAKAQVAAARSALDEAQARLADMEKGARPEEMAALTARLEAAQAALDLSAAELRRARALVARGAAPRERLDRAERDYQNDKAVLDERLQDHDLAARGDRDDLLAAQRAVIDQRRAELARVETVLSDLSTVSPAAGRVVDLFYREGEVVPQGTPVLSLLPPDGVKIIFFMPEDRLGALRLGQEVGFSCDGCDPGLTARISLIGDEVEYTPPVLYSVKFRAKLVIRVEAKPVGGALALHPGQPVDMDPALLAPDPTAEKDAKP